MNDILKRKSISQPLRPLRVDFFYMTPLQKQEQEVLDPQINDNSVKNSFDSAQRIERCEQLSSQSFCNSLHTKTNYETCSDNNSYMSISLQFGKIKKKYLDDYLFLGNLGKGAFGRVQKLKNKDTNNIYAGKTLLKTSNASTNKYKNKKLQTEIKIYQKLVHTNIPELHHIYTWKNEYTLIMQYVEGNSLHALLDDFPVDEKKIARIIYQILDTLEYLHGLNIVHHDIKPQNIIYDSRSQIVKIFDFGEAIQMSSPCETIKGQGGTFAYFAPEYFTDICSGKLDVWACGLILFYLLSGRVYFHQPSREEMKDKILRKPVLFDDYVWSSKSEKVKDLILKMLDKDPTKRLSAKEAKNHPWIVENTSRWNNPSKNLIRGILRNVKRSFSIEKQPKQVNERKLTYDLISAICSSSYRKQSRFRNNV